MLCCEDSGKEDDTMHVTRTRKRLAERETLAALVDREQQLLSKHLIGRVLGEIDLVEACITMIVSLAC